VTKEEALAVIQRIADAWNAFGQSLAEVAQALEEMIHGLGASDELWPKRNGMLPKKYGMALQRRCRKDIFCYRYTPPVPRNRPYQRRIF
jgi:hypothetical protein